MPAKHEQILKFTPPLCPQYFHIWRETIAYHVCSCEISWDFPWRLNNDIHSPQFSCETRGVVIKRSDFHTNYCVSRDVFPLRGWCWGKISSFSNLRWLFSSQLTCCKYSRHSKSNPIERSIFELVIYVKQTLKIHYQILEARVTSALSVVHVFFVNEEIPQNVLSRRRKKSTRKLQKLRLGILKIWLWYYYAKYWWRWACLSNQVRVKQI